MAVPMNSTEFRYTVEPILNKTFDGVYDQRADEWAQYFEEVQGIDRHSHEEPVLFGMSAAKEKPEGAPIEYDSGGTLYNAVYVYRTYGLAFALTLELVEDGEHISIGRIYSRQLAQSQIETKETLCANVLNRSFNASYPGGDGVSLVNTAHTSAPGAGVDSTSTSNRLTTDANLSQTSLESMLQQIRAASDPTGKKIRLDPRKLLIHPDNMFQAEVILKSVLRSGTANNDINAIQTMGLLEGGSVVISRLTSPTAWWVKTDEQMGLQLMMRRRLQKTMEGDFETDSMRYKTTERYIPGWTLWRTVYGTPGL